MLYDKLDVLHKIKNLIMSDKAKIYVKSIVIFYNLVITHATLTQV